MRLLCISMVLSMAVTGVNAAPPELPSVVRVDILSLLSPRQVIVTSTSAVRLSTGGSLQPGSRLSTNVEQRALRVRLNGRHIWRGQSITVGSPGQVVSVEVSGRNSRTRQLPAPVVISSRNNRIAIRAEFELEELVASAVAAEMKGSAGKAALEAAAVAIRSYIATSRGRHSRDGYDVCDSTHCVHSVGLVGVDRPEGSEAISAASTTAGRVLVRDDHIVVGFISACCGGRTATPADLWAGSDNGDFVEVACNWCRTSAYYSWTREVPASAIAGALSDSLKQPLQHDFSLRTERSAAGWVRSIRIAGSKRDHRVSGDEFRMAIGRRLGWDSLPSPNFEVSRERGAFVFRGAGFGHGIGLCLAGAVERARMGDSADAILRFYFPKASLVSLPRTSTGV